MKDTGGPAFPTKSLYTDLGCVEEQYENGMTLRDYFAGQYLVTFKVNDGSVTASMVAIKCYKVADAMIKERNK